MIKHHHVDTYVALAEILMMTGRSRTDVAELSKASTLPATVVSGTEQLYPARVMRWALLDRDL